MRDVPTSTPHGKGKILQVITDDDRRGAQTFAVDLQSGLSVLGWHIETVALAPGEVGGLDVDPLGGTRRSARTIRRLRAASRRFDVVVAHGSSTLPATALATLGTGRPFVYRQVSDSLYWAPGPARRMRVRAALRQAAAVVALWDGAGRVLVEHFAVPTSKLYIVPNGVLSDVWSLPSTTDRAKARQSFGVPFGALVVAFVGSLSMEKGPDLAVEVVADTPGVHLLMVGDGPSAPDVRALADELIADRVTFMGSLDDMPRVYAAADVLLLPSRSEGMPAVVIEAGLMEVPTIAAAVGALGSMIESGTEGSLVPRPERGLLAVELDRIKRDEQSRLAMGRAARQRYLASFGMESVSRQWERVLERVIVERRW